MENIISSTLIQHIGEEPSQVQQNTVALNHINVDVIPPRELPVKDVFICTDVEILTSKSKNSPPSDYISDNSSEYESAGSTKTSSTQSVNEIVNQEMGSEKVATPTLLGNALKAIKNVFSPSEKGRSKPLSASTPTAQNEKRETANHNDLHNGIDSKKMDYLDVSALGARLSSISLESQNVTDDSFTTTASRIDDSFQSTVTHFDEHNISDPDSNNQTKSDETFIEIPIDLDVDISCNETLGPFNNCLEETLLRRNSSDSSSEVRETDLAQVPEVVNSVLEILKMEDSPILESKGINCSTPITGHESVIILDSTMDESCENVNATIVVEALKEKQLNVGGVPSPEREIDNREENQEEEVPVKEEGNKTCNVESANEKTFNLDEEEKKEELNGVNDKTFELEAKELIREIEEKAINLEKSISESFGSENEVDAIISDETFNLDSNVPENGLEKTFNVEEGGGNDKTFDLEDEKCQVEDLETLKSDNVLVDETFSLENGKMEVVPEISVSNDVELERTFDLDGEENLEAVREIENEVGGSSKPESGESDENLVSEIEKYLASFSEIVSFEIKGTTPMDFLNLASQDLNKVYLSPILETSVSESVTTNCSDSIELEKTENSGGESELGSLEVEKVSSEANAPEIPVQIVPDELELVEKLLNEEEKSPEVADPQKVEPEPSVPESLLQNLTESLQKINLGEEEPEKVNSEGIAPEMPAQSFPDEFEIEEKAEDVAEPEKVELKPSEPEIVTQNLSGSLQIVNLGEEEPGKVSEEGIAPAQTPPDEFEIVEKLVNGEEKTKDVAEPEKVELKPSEPEILAQNLSGSLENEGTNQGESGEPEKISTEPAVPEICAQDLPNGFEIVRNSQEKASEPEKVDLKPSVPEILAQNLSNEVEELPESEEKIPESVEEGKLDLGNCAEPEKVDLKSSVPEILAQNLSNEVEELPKSEEKFPESVEEGKLDLGNCAEPEKMDFKPSVPEIPALNFSSEVKELLKSEEKMPELLEKEKVNLKNSTEPEIVNLESCVPEIPPQILSKTIELENSFNLASPNIENNKLEPEKLETEPEIQVEKNPGFVKPSEIVEKFILENSIKENKANVSGADSEIFFECETPENGISLEPEILRTAPDSEKSFNEELASVINHKVESREREKFDFKPSTPGNKSVAPELYKNLSNASFSDSNHEFQSPYEVNISSQGKHPEATEINLINPNESIKTETSKSITSPFDFLNKSKNIFHSLSNTPVKKYDSESEDLITGMENLKLDDSLKLTENDDRDFFGKIEHNSLLEDKLSSSSKSDKESDTDLAQLIQEQFTANDIEKICSVVDEIPMVNLNRQIMRASQLFEKSFHEKFLGDDDNIQNSLSPEGLDFLDSLQSKSSGRDFSRESLYVKFDPLVEAKKEEPARTEILLNITPPKQPVNVVAPLTPVNRKKEQTDENNSRVKELQQEIKRLTQLYLDREAANNEKINDYENQIAKLTGQACVLENKLRESAEREKALVRKLKEQNQSISDLKIIMEQYTIVISKLANELEETKRKNKEEQDVLIAERDSYMTHLQNTEAAFSDVHTKYEKSKKTIECYKKNEIMYKNTISEQSQLIEDYKEKAMEVKEKAVRELNKIHSEMDEMKSNHAQEASRVRAQLRKTELKVQALQESLDQKIKENKELTTICDDLIAGKK